MGEQTVNEIINQQTMEINGLLLKLTALRTRNEALEKWGRELTGILAYTANGEGNYGMVMFQEDEAIQEKARELLTQARTLGLVEEK